MTSNRRHSFNNRRTPRSTALIVALAVVVLVGASVAWAFFEPWWLQVSESTVVSPHVPPEFDGARFVYVSDIHAGKLLGQRHVRRVIDTVNAQKPLFVVLGGDQVDCSEQGSPFYTEAKRLDPPLGTYAVLGNHEGRGGEQPERESLEQAGIVLLDNDNVRLRLDGGSIRLAGIQDLDTGDPNAAAAASEIGAGEYAVLASHNPDALVVELPKTTGAWDLALSGHTHGGQVTLFGLYAPVIPSRYGQRFRSGWFELDGVPVLVSRGVGVFHLPVRFFARPQIHVITLRTGEPARVVR